MLAPSDRSAIWLGKTLATLAFLAVAELVALPAFALFFAPLDRAAVAGVVLASIGICAVGSLVSAMAAAARGREVVLPLLLPAPRDPARRRRRRGRDLGRTGARTLPSWALYDAVFAILSWAAFEYVVTE